MPERFLEILTRPALWAVVTAVVGFLSLTWLIRQAPLGQAVAPEPPGAPDPSRRDRAVIVGVAGFLTVLLGGFLATQAGVPESIPAFAIGISLTRWVVQTYRPLRHESPTIRRLVAFAETTLMGSLIAGILLVGNVLAFRLGGRSLDLTHDQAFSLSSLTLNQLRTLDRSVALTVFFGNSERSRQQRLRVQQLVDLYHAANPGKVRVEFLNPFIDVREFEELARRVPEVAASASDGMVVTYGEGPDAPRGVLGTRDLFEGVGTGVDRFSSTFRGEDVLTSTLIRLREGKRTRVAFTTGHGEPSTAENDLNTRGYGLWRARLAAVGSDVVEVNPLRDEIPADVSLLVVAGPKAPLQAEEIERIKRYMGRGGALLALVDNAEPTGLDELLATYNVALGSGVVADAKYRFSNRPTIIYAPLDPSVTHPIVSSLPGQVALLQNAAPLTLLGPMAGGGTARAANPGIIATPIVRTSPDSWVETDLQAKPVQFDRGKDTAGPVVVGVAATTRPAIADEPPTPRLVLFSSPTIADNRLLRTESTNIDLLMNSISWLRGKPELIGIAPKQHESLLFAADPGLQMRLVTVPTLAAVIVIIGLGLTTWLARRD